ncbi:MAG: L-serine ammonia-lyase, iron-sulfur-dependent, subunit alpha [Holophaga sp.]|nr:L-serine ammonia-lyase, iron-sulfur-dependent, subunit alpha [Holophaga sp.]
MANREGTLGAYRDAALEAGLPLSAIFLRQEADASGKSESQLRALMQSRIQVMRQSLEKGLSVPQNSRSGLIRGGAARMQQWLGTGASLLCPGFTRMIASAMAVAEVNACMGRVVAAPTAGACGVLPAAIFTVADARQASDEAVQRAFFTAGGIGLVIEKLASLSGAEGGCQAEVGSGSAMAAGGLVELMGGSPAQVDHAVAFALSNVMGLICDPVAGLVEIPCVKRNVMGAVNAAACAEMALAGLESVFCADAVIETMGKVGRRLPEEFRETARGGLAALPLP